MHIYDIYILSETCYETQQKLSYFPVEKIISLELLALFTAEQREMSAQKP
jgi:hypothetical protein